MIAALLALLILIPWAGALVVWAAGRIAGERLQHLLAAGFALAAGVVALAALPFASSQPALRLAFGAPFGDLTLTPDGLGLLLVAVASVIGSLTVVFSINYMHGEDELGRYYALILLFIGAMNGLALSGSLLFLFFFWEITALCSYALISFYNDDPAAVAGGIKALIITQLGGVGLLGGALLLYTYTGAYDIAALNANPQALPVGALTLMAFGLLAAAAAKSAQVPFHTWLPDAMEAPTPVSALIHAATMVNAGVYLLIRFYPAFAAVPYWRTAVMVVGLLSALLAALMALVAQDLKRLLAYSTVSQLGYMVYAIGAGGVFAASFHLLSHAVFKALLFLAAGAVIHAVGTRDLRRMGGLSAVMPTTRNAFLAGALSLAGIPIFSGFWSKELVLESGAAGGPPLFYAVMVFGAGLTAFYTLRGAWLVFFAPAAERRPALHAHADAGFAMRLALIPLALGSLAIWLLAGPLSHWLAATLPNHALHTASTFELAAHVLADPATWLALAVTALGLAAYAARARLAWMSRLAPPLTTLAEHSFGFEDLNRAIVRRTTAGAEALRRLQTGQLNWNMVGLAATLLTLLAWLGWSL